MSINWTQELSERLEELLQDHALYYTDIAGILSKEFKLTISKNACIGKAKRMRMPQRDKTLGLWGRVKTSRDIKYKPRVPRNPRNVRLWELEPGECRWPDGDYNYTFCGLPQVEGTPYCVHHNKRAHHGPR